MPPFSVQWLFSNWMLIGVLSLNFPKLKTILFLCQIIIARFKILLKILTCTKFAGALSCNVLNAKSLILFILELAASLIKHLRLYNLILWSFWNLIQLFFWVLSLAALQFLLNFDFFMNLIGFLHLKYEFMSGVGCHGFRKIM